MPLTPEDGTGLAAADSYISEADSRTYAVERYPATDPFLLNSDLENEPFLRRAAEELDGRFRRRYVGTRFTVAQGLEWPRVDVPDPSRELLSAATTYPERELGRAQVEVARRLVQDIDVKPDATEHAVKRSKVDVLETEFATPTGSRSFYDMPQVEEILSAYLTSAGVLHRA